LRLLLDVGCGTGYFLKRIYEEVSNEFMLFGIDISNIAIQRGKNLYPFLNLTTGDAHCTNYPNKKFDIIVSYGSYEHFNSAEIALKEVGRIIKRGGIILTMQPTLGVYRTDRDDEGWYEETDHAQQFQWNLKRETWEKIFTSAGFNLFPVVFSKQFGAIKPGNFYFGWKL